MNLDVTLDVPVELDNRFRHQVGYFDWEFRIEEFPTEEGDPTAPDTGDRRNVGLWLGLMAGSLILLCVTICRRKKQEKHTEP